MEVKKVSKENIKQSSSSSGIEAEGKTVEEAIQKGLKLLGLPKEKVEIKILDEGTSGLFGLMGSKPAKVRLQPKQSNIQINAEIENFLRTCITNIIELMDIKKQKYKIEIRPEVDAIELNLNFTDEKTGSLLIGKNGKTLQALNTIIQAIINNKYKNSQGKPLRINLDINNYHLKQEEKIKDIINKAIRIVRKTKKPYILNPMNPKLRRFVHFFLKDSKEFETCSEGEGANRRVIIKPKQ